MGVRTDQDYPLFTEATFQDAEWHHDGIYRYPRVSQALADLVAGDWDLTNFRNDRKPTKMVPDVQPDVRERAEFLFGLSELLKGVFSVGEVEHTNDWDWYVQVEAGGVWYGDYYKDGKHQDWEKTPDEAINYCDSFHTAYDQESYGQMGNVPEAQEYYANLEIVLESWRSDPTQKQPEETRLKVGEVTRIIISQR